MVAEQSRCFVDYRECFLIVLGVVPDTGCEGKSGLQMESGESPVDRLNYGVSEGPSFVAAPLRSVGRFVG
jgi:hypothetical protein